MSDKQSQANQALIEPLTERELEVLQLISEGLSNREIAQELFVALSTVKWYIKQIYGKLQVENRNQAIEQATHLALVETEASTQHNLPVQNIALIGRERELDDLRSLLDDAQNQLITITGSGGSGKTRLALELAAQIKNKFTDGAFFIPLAPLSSSDFIISSIAEAIGFDFYQGLNHKQQLLEYLREKEMLLVLDNFEHLLSGVDMIADIQAISQDLKIIVTSRESLNLYGETLYPISGIAYPSLDESLSQASDYPAIVLFEQSARRVEVDFELNSDSLQLLIAICEQLQGLPLAIEMAAAWLRLLSLPEIEAELAKNLDFLASNRRDIPERHRTMRAVFDHSWELLKAEEQAIFQALSIFRGGFRREAAEHIAQANLMLLSSLADKSLLHRDDTGRYQVHELLRQYAAEKLSDNIEESPRLGNRHSAYYAAFIHEKTVELRGGNQGLALNEINMDIANIRLGWEQALSNQEPEHIEQYLNGLRLFFYRSSQIQEGLNFFNKAVSQLDTLINETNIPKKLYALALAGQGLFQSWALDYRTSKEALLENLALMETIDARQESAFVMYNLGILVYISGDYAQAEQYIHRGFEICNEFDDSWLKSLMLDAFGRIYYRRGEYAKSQEVFEEVVQICRATGDTFQLASGLSGLSRVAIALGNYQIAEQYLQEGLAIDEEVGNRTGMTYVLDKLGDVAYRQGQYARAQDILNRAVSLGLANIHEGVIFSHQLARVQRRLGQIAIAQGDYPTARKHFLAAFTTVPEAQHMAMYEVLNLVWGMASLLAHEGQPERAFLLLAFTLEHPSIPQTTKEDAQDLISELEAELPSQTIADLGEKASELSLENVILDLIAELEA